MQGALADDNPRFLGATFPVLPFDPLVPARFMFNGLMRNLIFEAKTCPPEKNDGLDFCHAINSSSAFRRFLSRVGHGPFKIDGLPWRRGTS